MNATPLQSSGMRLAKQLSANLRLCSRREAEEWIMEGRVALNGTQAEIGAKVALGDTILVKGIPGEGSRVFHVSSIEATQELPRMYLAHKQAGEICARTKENNIFDNLEFKGLPRGLIMAGGLDVMASGLVLLTDNSALRTALDDARLNQVFFVKCASHGPPDQVALRWLKSGPMVGRARLPSITANLLQSKYLPTERAYRSEISIAFKGGKFGEVKSALSKIGLATTAAERRRIGPFNLDKLRLGEAAELTPKVVEQLLEKALPGWAESRSPSTSGA